MNKEYLKLLMEVGYDRGYMMFIMSRQACYQEWLAMCYEIHDIAIKHYRMKHGETATTIWSASEFRKFCASYK